MEEEGKKKKDTRRRVNIGARTGMIAPVISLGATAAISIHTYWQHYPLIWWLIIFFGSLAAFLFLGSIVQTMVEIIVERIIDKEAEEKRLREIEAMHGEGDVDEEDEDLATAQAEAATSAAE